MTGLMEFLVTNEAIRNVMSHVRLMCFMLK